MKSIVSIAFCSLILYSGSVFANYYICEFADGDYVAHFNLNKKIVAVFDGDYWPRTKLSSIKNLESNPPQKVYFFQGLDELGQKKNIQFNVTRLSGTSQERMLNRIETLAFTCKKAARNSLWETVR